MKKIALVPNLITTFGMSCGLFVIMKMALLSPSDMSYQVIQNSVVILIIAAVADLLDGAVARLLKAESEFGKNFDSLSDAITFGIAPGVVVLKSTALDNSTTSQLFILAAAMLYSMCGIFRLVRFNVKATQESSHQLSLLQEHKKHFTGLPIPAAASSVLSAALFLHSDFFDTSPFSINLSYSIIIAIVMIIIGYFMISRWKFPSLKTLHIKINSIQPIFISSIIAVFLVLGIIHCFPILYLAISWLYLVIAWVIAIIRLIAGKRSNALKDFEPEPDDDFMEE